MKQIQTFLETISDDLETLAVNSNDESSRALHLAVRRIRDYAERLSAAPLVRETKVWKIKRQPAARHWYVAKSHAVAKDQKEIELVEKIEFEKCISALQELKASLGLPLGLPTTTELMPSPKERGVKS